MSILNGYQRTEAQICATLCNIAYQEENSTNYPVIKNAINTALSDPKALYIGANWRLCWLGISPDFGNLMYLAADTTQPGTYAIVHRGTDWNYLDDVVQDMDVYNTSRLSFLNPPHPDIYVAKGAMDGLTVLQQMKDTPDSLSAHTGLVGILDCIKSLSSPVGSPLNIYITGHSLGGALATLFTTWLLEMLDQEAASLPPVFVKTYSIASPTIGNVAYVNYYNSKMTSPGVIPFQGYRIHNLQDLVPAAFADLAGLPDNGIPLGLMMKEVLKTAVLAVTGTLKLEGLAYVPAGVNMPLLNNPPTLQPPCTAEASSLKEYGCWVGYEHSLDTYLSLI